MCIHTYMLLLVGPWEQNTASGFIVQTYVRQIQDLILGLHTLKLTILCLLWSFLFVLRGLCCRLWLTYSKAEGTYSSSWHSSSNSSSSRHWPLRRHRPQRS